MRNAFEARVGRLEGLQGHLPDEPKLVVLSGPNETRPVIGYAFQGKEWLLQENESLQDLQEKIIRSSTRGRVIATEIHPV